MRPLFTPQIIRKENSSMGGNHVVAPILDHSGGIHYLNETAFRISQLCDGRRSVEEIIEIIDEEYAGDRWSKAVGVYKTVIEGLRRGFVVLRGGGFAATPRVVGSPPNELLLNMGIEQPEIALRGLYRGHVSTGGFRIPLWAYYLAGVPRGVAAVSVFVFPPAPVRC